MTSGSHDPHFLLNNLMDNMTDRIYFKDRQSRFILVNRAVAEWYGFDRPEDLLGKTDFDLFSGEEAQRLADSEQRMMASGEALEGVVEKEIRRDGRSAWVSTTKMPLRDGAGNIVGTFGVSRDISVQREAELETSYYVAQIKRIKEEMEEELRIAAELQKTFFPRSYPAFPKGATPEVNAVRFHHYYRASGLVSGDFCSVRRLSATKSGILLCDVMGHGVRAALGTALLYAMVEELSHQIHEPGPFLGRLNELLLPILRQDDTFLYATACYAVFDASTGRLCMANAGHPSPIHLRTAEQRAEWLTVDAGKRGPALAIEEGAEYPCLSVNLQPGDAVVMYTDGLYEVEGPGNEEFGEERLLAAARRGIGCPLPELFPALLEEAGRFAGEGGFDDDVCLIGFDYRNPMPKEGSDG